MIFLTLLGFPLLVAFFFLVIGKHRVTWIEFLVHVGIQLAIAGASVYIIWNSNTGDTEVWNGSVAKKERLRVSCQHSYRCNCHNVCTSTGKTRTCTQVCSTCYDHSYDIDWRLTTTNSEQINIHRLDRQGLKEPPRWASARVGDPTALTHSYVNYIKAAPDTLFRRQGLVEQYIKKLPTYPIKVYNYHYIDRVVAPPSSPRDWNSGLQLLNADLGKAKQVNMILVFTLEKNPEFGEALEQLWLGGKKNDVAAVVGHDGYKPLWAHIIAWTDAEIFKVKLRDAIVEMQSLDRGKILDALRENVASYYKRKSMEDFEYLASSVTPSTTQWVVSMLVGFLSSVGVGMFFYHYDFD